LTSTDDLDSAAAGALVTETDVGDLVQPEPDRRRGPRWKAAIGLAGLVGLAIAAFTSVDDAREQALPGWQPLLAAGFVQIMSVMLSAQAWVSLFPPDADHRQLARGLYTSQLTKYLPAGGIMQAASQVALSSEPGGVAFAALRLPVFSLCSVVAASTVASFLALSGDIPTWGRLAAGATLLTLVVLHRRVLVLVLRTARRFIRRLPEPTALPPQPAILRCYAFALLNMITYAGAFVILLGDLADIDPLRTGAALGAGWAAGYLVVPLPSGLGVREAVLRVALPGVAIGSLLGASLAHRLLGLCAEGLLAGTAHLRASLRRSADRRSERS
jgi:hypothetical protein